MDSEGIVITGASGQLGRALQHAYPEATAVDSNLLDITNPLQVASYDWSSVKVIINAAAYTNVDNAESPDGRVAAWQVNAVGAANLARVAIERDITLVHISSDYVFDGTKSNHSENESFSPLGVYGQSKAAGDIAVSLAPKHYIFRTTWVIGEGANFVRTMLDLGERGVSPTVVSDQIGRLTFTTELVSIINHVLRKASPYGTYNATNVGPPKSWAEITRDIFKTAGFNLTVTDTTTQEYFREKPQAAPRPLNSIMDLSKLQATGYTGHDWQEDLKPFIHKEITT